jgi:hypothetical protein
MKQSDGIQAGPVKKFDRCTPEMMKSLRIPKLQVLNTSRIEGVEEFNIFSPRTGTAFNIICQRVTIQEVLELDRFPFDRQIIKLKMQTFGSNIQPWFVQNEETPYRIVNNKQWVNNEHIVLYDSCEWKLEWAESEFIDEERQKIFILSFGISRDPSFYIWNVALFHFILVLLSAFACAIDFVDFGARSQVTYTLLLTLVAFKFVVATFVPRISYLTYLDRYSFFSVFMLCLNIAENFAVAMDGGDTAHSVDQLFFTAFAGVWLLSHVVLAACAKAGWFYADWDKVRKYDNAAPQCQPAKAVSRNKDRANKAESNGDGGCAGGAGCGSDDQARREDGGDRRESDPTVRVTAPTRKCAWTSAVPG